MSEPRLSPAESLREPGTAVLPDPRTSLSLEAHHARISSLRLSPVIPEPIAIQFETARNLYLHAWHVYRFYMVAVTQAPTTLEFGLRERLPQRLPQPYQWPRQSQPMLAGLLRYAIDQRLIRNDGFERWHRAAEQRARERRSDQAMQTLIDQGLEFIEVNEDESVEIEPQDREWDLVAHLQGGLPSLRNELAHGSSMLTREMLGTLELVAGILNQLYPEHPEEGPTG